MKAWWLSFLVLVLLSTSSVFADRSTKGLYEVPVGPELASYASYPVSCSADKYKVDPTRLQFPLPSALVGEEMYLEMKKAADGSNLWSGPNVSGTCQTVGRYFKCQLKFEGLAIDPLKVQSAINAEFQSPEEKVGRLKVAERFSGEPIGILTYKLHGHGSDY